MVLKIADSYLKDRTQYSQIGKIESAKNVWVKCGVPQGSILGLLVFIIYLNDVPSQKSKAIKTILYVDDTVVFIKVVLRL